MLAADKSFLNEYDDDDDDDEDDNDAAAASQPSKSILKSPGYIMAVLPRFESLIARMN